LNTLENPKIILAIESAISGGSLAMFRDSELIGSKTGNSGVSRAEDLLLNIDELVAETIRDKRHLQEIVISTGPGSFTGLRIGIATVMGLKRSLGIEVIGVSLFEEMARAFSCLGSVFTAVPMGKADVCIQEFQNTEAASIAVDPPKTISRLEFKSLINISAAASLILHADLLQLDIDFVSIAGKGVKIIDAGRDLASIIGLAANRRSTGTSLAPIYVQSPRFV